MSTVADEWQKFKWKSDTPLTVKSREDFESKCSERVLPEVASSKTDHVPRAKFKKIAELETRATGWISNSLSYSRLKKCDKTEIDYVSDEDDIKWLARTNRTRNSSNLSQISTSLFEQLMDMIEKESYFQVQVNKDFNYEKCSVCKKDSPEKTLTCYMCSLKVHELCYGRMYDSEFIQDRKWFCRRCFDSPSIPVECIFCPSKHGVFFPTDTFEWAHVVCAFWIPEISFRIQMKLDKVIYVERVESKFGKSKCYICLEQTGICLQCSNQTCSNSFHVTCAQEADLITETKIEPPNYITNIGLYCHNCKGEQETWHQKLECIRNTLKKKRTTFPVIVNHTIQPEIVEKLVTLTQMKTSHIKIFINELIHYWKDKREINRGVPLIRALPSMYTLEFIENDFNNGENSEIRKKVSEHPERLVSNLEKARIFLKLEYYRGELEKQLIEAKRLLVQDIINALKMDPCKVRSTQKIVELRIMINKIDDCLIENWKTKTNNFEDMIPGVFISNSNTLKEAEEEIRRTQEIIMQNEKMIQTIRHTVENGLIELTVPFSLSRIRKNPENLGKFYTDGTTEDSRNRANLPPEDQNHSIHSKRKNNNGKKSSSGQVKRKRVQNNKKFTS